MARFFGRHEHSLDDKGRVILPAKFRAHFERGGYLAPEQDGCLSLWTPDQFELQMDAMMERASSGRSDRNLVRLWASTSHELEIDRQGRMAIPSRLASTPAWSPRSWCSGRSTGWNCGTGGRGKRRSSRRKPG